ncbi:hypothetical protein A0H81_05685 [Grifola frondosa]|uniref:Uncharacterized protein n=1 Tax=Grifola frondosa TaxID=5627 RepID=A0A1C7MDA8_GRIFR|nr:hypothetical protein A0H81_05685 [Grifola frondosa]
MAITKKNCDKQAELDAEIKQWFDDAVALLKHLSDKFGKNADYYLNQMFSGALRLRNSRQPNAYNAWSHHIAKEANEASQASPSNLLDLQQEKIDDYYDLTEEQREQYVNELVDQRQSRSTSLRTTQRGRTQDVNNVCGKIVDLLLSLKQYVGIEAFFCIFRNSPNFHMSPRWYFTLEQINQYLATMIQRWEIDKIGAMVEAFAIAGCNYMNLLRNSKLKAAFLKASICDKINAMLVEITGNSKAVMNYASFESEIVLRYRIQLIGWTADKWTNPSELSNAVAPLQQLLDAIENGACRFEHLASHEFTARKKKYDEDVAAGRVA